MSEPTQQFRGSPQRELRPLQRFPGHAVARELWAWGRRSWVREFWAWARWQRAIVPSVEQLAESIAALHASAPDAAGDLEAPIFLLATGWRTGSTLLQRILVTDPRLLLWGEPLGEMALVSEIARMVFRHRSYPGLEKLYIDNSQSSSSMATSWIGTLYPPADDFRTALRTFFDRWLGEPVRQRGFTRWGLKEVRLGATEAYLLHWLYPRAKFLLLTRHPYDCYRSLADSGWHHVYYRRPDVRVDSAFGFASHWNRLAVSWSELPAGFPSFQIKYEDLIGGTFDFRKLESWLDIKIREDVALSVAVVSTSVSGRLSWHNRLIIAHEAAAGMRALGYSK
jgi:hypothetical protein